LGSRRAYRLFKLGCGGIRSPPNPEAIRFPYCCSHHVRLTTLQHNQGQSSRACRSLPLILQLWRYGKSHIVYPKSISDGLKICDGTGGPAINCPGAGAKAGGGKFGKSPVARFMNLDGARIARSTSEVSSAERIEAERNFQATCGEDEKGHRVKGMAHMA
jgi:hypothetical protein